MQLRRSDICKVDLERNSSDKRDASCQTLLTEIRDNRESTDLQDFPL